MEKRTDSQRDDRTNFAHKVIKVEHKLCGKLDLMCEAGIDNSFPFQYSEM